MTILFLVIVSFIATYVGTIVGFGSAIILIPILLYFYPLPLTLIFAGVVHLLVDIWQVSLFRKDINYKVLLYFGLPSVIFAIIGARILLVANHEMIIGVLGVILAGYGIFELIRPEFKIKNTQTNNVIGGSVSGFTSGIAGIGGPMRSVFLQGFGLPKREYLATIGAVAFLVDMSRTTAYLSDGVQIESDFVMVIVLVIPISLFAAVVARRTINTISDTFFRKLVAIFLIISGFVLTFQNNLL